MYTHISHIGRLYQCKRYDKAPKSIGQDLWTATPISRFPRLLGHISTKIILINTFMSMIITINVLTVTKNEGFGGCANDHCDTTIVLDEIRETDLFVGGLRGGGGGIFAKPLNTVVQGPFSNSAWRKWHIEKCRTYHEKTYYEKQLLCFE